MGDGVDAVDGGDGLGQSGEGGNLDSGKHSAAQISRWKLQFWR